MGGWLNRVTLAPAFFSFFAGGARDFREHWPKAVTRSNLLLYSFFSIFLN